MKEKEKQIYEYLKNLFKEGNCELNFKNNYELLVAVILSAQCTDKRVNLTTPKLFEKYPTVFEMAKAKIEDVEEIIKPCGFYHNKAKNIVSACKDIATNFGGEVPEEFEDLIKLSGVGRKTANVVMSVGFGKDAIAVDTHVFRVSKRLGLSKGETPEKVEFDLMKKFDKTLWSETHHLMVLFGRYICKAQKPLCEKCELKDKCLYFKKLLQNKKNVLK